MGSAWLEMDLFARPLNWTATALFSVLVGWSLAGSQPGMAHRAWVFSSAQLAAAEPQSPVQLVVPAYFYPSGPGLEHWNQLLSAARDLEMIAIVNPDSGPGKRRDPAYRDLLVRASQTRLQLVGYITWSYGERPLSAIRADIDSWLYFYPEITGFFFDEQPSGAAFAPAVLDCLQYARQQRPQAVLLSNPGVPCDAAYFRLPTQAITCVFEEAAGWDQFLQDEAGRRAAGERQPPAATLGLLYRHTEPKTLDEVFRQASQAGVAYLYVTDAVMPNPWDRLPEYWAREVEVARRYASRARQ